MRRICLFLLSLVVSVRCFGGAGVASINFDPKTLVAMTTGYLSETQLESASLAKLQEILDHYTSAEVATAGIFTSKWLDRRAMTNAGLFSNAQENFYYNRIRRLVKDCIMPKVLSLAVLMLQRPDKALYWGPYLMKVCDQTMQLCLTFETVVTNGKLSFQDLMFLTISDELRQLFDLAKLGDVDWATLWDKLTDFGDGLTKEDLMEDLQGLLDAGGSIASAGGAILDSTWTNASRVGKVFKMKPREIRDLFKDFRSMYETFSDPTKIKNLVMDKVLSTDSAGVSRLFSPAGYNVTNYISNYFNELQGRYYKQCFQVVAKCKGRELVHEYIPPMDNYSIANSDEWYRVKKVAGAVMPTNEDRELSLQNSELYAGISRFTCNVMNATQTPDKHPLYTYEFKNEFYCKKINFGNTGLGLSMAHEIRVWKNSDDSWVCYEEWFDSQFDNLDVLYAKLEGIVSELQETADPNQKPSIKYSIEGGVRQYYDAADEEKMKGCASVSYTMTCDGDTKLGDGNFSWKENGNQRTCLNENSMRYAMETTLSDGAETAAVDEVVNRYSSEVDRLSSTINSLDAENKRLSQQISTASVEEATELRQQYNSNLEQINALRPQLSAAQDSLSVYQALRQEILEDYADEEDDSYRIPAVMHSLESTYGFVWTDEGSWVSFCRDSAVYVRHGKLPNIEGTLEFRARLKPERQESHNWMIGRYHRAILGVGWSLVGHYTSSETIDFVELDNSLSDEEKAEFVNRRHRELMDAHPDCRIEANYAYSGGYDTSDDEDAIHLLWVCDRLAIARDVDYRLSKIYAELILLEKFMLTRESTLDLLRRSLGLTTVGRPGLGRIGGRSYRRWIGAATAVVTGQSIADVLAAMGDDE